MIRHFLQIKTLVRIIGRAQCHEQQTVLRTGARHAQGAVKALPQAAGEGQRSAQIEHVALDGPALGKARDGLVHHRLVDTGGNVLGPGTLVDEGLDVALGKHTAAGGNGVRLLRLLGSCIHLVSAHLQKGRHLVDESTGTAGAGAVHPHFRSAGQKQDLGILTTQLDDDIRTGHQTVGGYTGGKHLLHEGDPHALRHAHAGGAGDSEFRPSAGNIPLRHPAQQFFGFLKNMAEMPFVCTVYNVARVIQNHTFDGSGPHVETYFQSSFLLWENGYQAVFAQNPQDTTLIGMILFSSQMCNRQYSERM